MVLGCRIGITDCSCVDYADDIAVCSLYPNSMKSFIDMAYYYSQKWRFTFNNKKCATLVYGKQDEKCAFKLGNDPIDVCEQYNHLGIMNKVKCNFDKKSATNNVNSMKFAFFSTLGCSTYKTNLSMATLSKLYKSVALPKLITGSEVRFICDREIAVYELAHRNIAKCIQQLPKHCADAVALAALGWLHIESYVDKCKLMFFMATIELTNHQCL